VAKEALEFFLMNVSTEPTLDEADALT